MIDEGKKGRSRAKVCLLGLENLPVLAPQYEKFYFGGEQVQQTLLARALRRCGYDVAMVVGDYGQSDGAAWEGIRTYKAFRFDEGIPVFRFLYPRWVKLWAALRRADADAYYTSCAGMHVGLLALFCMRYRRGFVFRLASDGDADPAKVMIRYRRDKILYKYGLCKAHCVLAQHKDQQKNLWLNYGVRSTIANLFVERPGRLYPPKEKDIDVLWVSNVQPVKRPELVPQLAKLLPHRKFCMVGGSMVGEKHLFERVKKEAASISNLAFQGAIPYRDIGKYFDRAKIFINTSDLEGFPNSYLQSWARGVPVIAFFDPENLMGREKLGVAVKTITEMKTEIENLLLDEIRWGDISNNAYRYVEENLNENDVVKVYCKAIEQARLTVIKSNDQ
ncbi:MAG: glycosyltransferase family 4 protein [Desulfobacterales bacterium]